MAAFGTVDRDAPRPSTIDDLKEASPLPAIHSDNGRRRVYGKGKRDANVNVHEAYDNYRCVPELSAITMNEASRVGRCRFLTKIWDADEDTLVDDNSDMARETWTGFVHKDSDSSSEMVERWALNTLIAGKLWLIGEEAPGRTMSGFEWSIVAPTKFRKAQRSSHMELFEHGDWRRFDGYSAPYTIGDPEDHTKPDAPGLRLVDVGRQIRLLDNVIDSWASMSMHGGILKVPAEFMTNPNERLTDEMKHERIAKFKQALSDELFNAAASPGSVDQLAPMVILGASQHLQNLEMMEYSSDVVKWAKELRSDNVQRLGRGFDAPQESMTGKDQLSHWTSANVDQDRVRNYTVPRGEKYAEWVTAKFYRPWLEAAYGLSKQDAACRFIVCDPAVLLSRGDMQSYAMQAYNSGEMSGREMVRAIGADPDQVMMTDDEKREWRMWQLLKAGHTEYAPYLGLPDITAGADVQVVDDDMPMLEGPSAREIDADMPDGEPMEAQALPV